LQTSWSARCASYLDPPFNTQQSFLQYDDALEHSVWLTMMRDRLLRTADEGAAVDRRLLDRQRGGDLTVGVASGPRDAGRCERSRTSPLELPQDRVARIDLGAKLAQDVGQRGLAHGAVLEDVRDDPAVGERLWRLA